jgi:cellulose 1,4-beta-cellobiosidase
MPVRQNLVATAVICLTTSSIGAHAAQDGSEPRVPLAPATVMATPGNAKVRLTWTPVSGASGYRVFRGANGRWDPKPIAITPATSYTSKELENGIRYSFTVAAYSSEGDGPLSLAVMATPLGPPSDVTAAAGDKRITLKWTLSAGATSYVIYRRMTTDPEFYELATGVLAPPFIDTGLTNGRRYFYQVRAVSGDAESDRSETATAVASGPPTEPH